MKTIDNFCGQKNGYSRSITLRNALIPIGKTEENIQKLKLLDKDVERSKAYVEVKKLIDDFHRTFIEEVLSKTKLEWGPLYEQFELYQNEKDKQKKNKIKKQLEQLQSGMRKDIVKQFKKDERFDKLFKKELLSDFVPTVIKNDESGTISDKQAALDAFKGFATYFTGFHQNRQNMYSEEAQSTAISNRIVNENFPKFYANVKLFEYLQKEFPEIIKETEDSLSNFLNGKRLAEIFSENGFNAVLSQNGIDFYNTVIGGISDEAGSKKLQGLNEKINLASQQLPKEEKYKLKRKMTVLYKQILSDRSTASFIPVGFETSEKVYESVKQFKEQNFDKVVSLVKKLSSKTDYDLNQIYVPAKEVTEFSLKLFGNWSILHDGLFLLEKDNAKKNFSEKQMETLRKEIAKRDCSLAELQKVYEELCSYNGEQLGINEKGYLVKKTYNDKDKIELNVRDNFFRFTELRLDENTKEKSFIDILKEIDKNYSQIDFDKQENLIKEKESATPIKNFLDEVQNLYHYLKLVDYRGEEQKDSDFYSGLDEILQMLSEIIPLYNKVRNFVTKKPNDVKKVKLNFDCPTLVEGWDLNRESSNNAIILRKDGNYYLGIYNPNDKPKFETCTSGEEYYEKMIYKQLGQISQQLPRIAFSRVWQEKVKIPEEVIRIKKTESFKTSKDDLQKLIEYYKFFITQHEEWNKFFSINFSNRTDYKNLPDFYSEVDSQFYDVSFTNISKKYVNQMVDSGKLFLFQIYNKDYSTGKDGGNGSTGKKNLHTLYWENLFSEENLRDVCLKLNGGAELFSRNASPNVKDVCHKKGSILVNRTTSDGKSIPEDIYQEIYQFKNKMTDKVSDKAKELLDSGKVVCKEARFDITKDRHFTKQTYLFHCPITMNFKAPEISNKDFNSKVQTLLKNNSDIKIIGLDRGERHLIYLSLINQKGEIELQKTLNLVEQVRNDRTVPVNYQEKLVQKEGDRDKARKNWQTIGNIKELKEGYLSNIVHEIAKMMVENNAIVVMEDLNFGFKRGRFAVERQVYQKFENMLIEKLNYLVFKDKKLTEPGGVLNAYQLAKKPEKKTQHSNQYGWIFYIPAAYTSKIDPKTGFANLFYTAGITNIEKKKDFFDKFDSIRYDRKTDSFVFSFDYSNFSDNADFKKKWEVYSKGERLVFSKSEKTTVSVNPTENLKALFDKQGINWNTEYNFIDQIHAVQAERDNCAFYDGLYRSFIAILQMRNSKPNSSNQEDDYLISPVMADDGTFYDSRVEATKGKDSNGRWISKLPVDADANGAYHIALKGLYLLKNDFNLNDKGCIDNISNAEWFKFAQEKDYAE